MQPRTIALFAFLISLVSYGWLGFLLVAPIGAANTGVPGISNFQSMALFALLGAIFTAGMAYAFERSP